MSHTLPVIEDDEFLKAWIGVKCYTCKDQK